MVARNFAWSLAAIVSAAMLAPFAPAGAEDLLRIAVAQRGQWDTAVIVNAINTGIGRFMVSLPWYGTLP